VKYPVLILAGVMLVAAAPPPPTPLPSPPPLAQPTPAVSPGATFTVPPAPTGLPSATPTPSLDTIMGGNRNGKGPHAKGTPTPPPPTRTGLDGVWEIQIQRGPKTQYVHMKLDQTGDMLTGYYLNDQNKKYPIAGALDGQHNVRLVVSRPDGTTILLDGRVDGTTDMIGMFTDSKERVPFTAAYRPKEKYIDNINAAPGGFGGGGP
jgi:hypothetical protein